MPAISPLSQITRLNATVKDLLIYAFDLAPLDVDTLFTLMKIKKPLTIDDLAKRINRDRTTASRSAQKLANLGLLSRDTVGLRDGGYYHVYDAVDKQTFKLEVEKRTKEIQESFGRILKKLENDVDKLLSTI